MIYTTFCFRTINYKRFACYYLWWKVYWQRYTNDTLTMIQRMLVFDRMKLELSDISLELYESEVMRKLRITSGNFLILIPVATDFCYSLFLEKNIFSWKRQTMTRLSRKSKWVLLIKNTKTVLLLYELKTINVILYY